MMSDQYYSIAQGQWIDAADRYAVAADYEIAEAPAARPQYGDDDYDYVSGDPMRDEMEAEWGARYDYAREAYGADGEGAGAAVAADDEWDDAAWAAWDAQVEATQARAQRVIDETGLGLF